MKTCGFDSRIGKSLILFIIYSLVAITSFAQEKIEFETIETGPYGQNSSIAVLFKPSGAFPINNVFELYLSDASGNFSPGTKIGQYQRHYTTFINGVIPSGTPASSNYKLKIVATSGGNNVAEAISPYNISISNAQGESQNYFASPAGLDQIGNNLWAWAICNGNATSVDIDNNLDKQITCTLKNEFDTTAAFSSDRPQTFTIGSAESYTVPSINSVHYQLLSKVAEISGVISTQAIFIVNNKTVGPFSAVLNYVCYGRGQAGYFQFKVDVDRNITSTPSAYYNFPGYLYEAMWDDGLQDQYSIQQIDKEHGLITHGYRISSCDRTVTTNSKKYYNSLGPTLQVLNFNPPCSQTVNVVTPIQVFEKPEISFSAPSKACQYELVTFTNTSSLGAQGPSDADVECTAPNITFQWYVDGKRVSTATNYETSSLSPGEHTIMLKPIYSSNSVTCAPSPFTKTICIVSDLTPEFKMDGAESVVSCAPREIKVTNQTNASTCDESNTYKWSVLYQETGLEVSSTSGIYTVSPSLNVAEPTFTFQTPGKYIIKLTANNSCFTRSKERSVNIVDFATISFPGEKRYCDVRTINFGTDANHIPTYSTSGGANEKYEWSVGGGTYSFVGGTGPNSPYPQIQFNEYKAYTVTNKFTNNCGNQTASQKITFDQPLTTDAGVAPSVCYNDNNISLSGSASGPYSGLAWSTTDGKGSFNPINTLNTVYTFNSEDKSRSYITLTLTALQANGSACSNVPDNMIVYIKPKVYASDQTTSICSGTSVNMTPTGNQLGATYAWTTQGTTGAVSGNSANGSGTINDVLVNTTTTNATVTYRIVPTYDGCTGDAGTLVVTVKPRPNVVVPDNLILCGGAATGNLHFSSSLAGTTFTWDNSNTSIGLSASGTGDIPSFNVENNGTSPVTATITVTPSNNNCSGTSQPFTITVKPKPAAPTVSAISYCQGATAGPLTATTLNGYNLKWYTSTADATGSTTAPTPSTDSYGATTYYVSAVNPSTGCESDRTPLTVTVKEKPVISYGLYANTTSCGSSTGSITLYGLKAGSTYDVTYTNGGVAQTITHLANSSGQIIISNLSAGTYFNIYVTLNDCSSTEVGPFTISDPAAPATPVITGVSSICSGSTLTLNASTTTAGTITYNWSGPNGSTYSGATLSISNAQTSASGTYSVVAVLNGCTSASASVPVTINLTPATPSVGNNDPKCSGNTLNLTASTTTAGDISYSWTGPNGYSSSTQNPVISNAATTHSGTYSVTATLGSCTSAAGTTTVAINPTPAISSGAFTDPDACNTNTGNIKLGGLTINTQYTVTYKKNGVAQTPVQITADGSGYVTISNLYAGNYSNVSVTLNGCVSNEVGPFELKDPNPPATPSISGATTLCAESNLSLTASSETAGVSYAWSGPGSISGNSQTLTINNVSAVHSGTYTVVVTKSSCTAHASVTVTINPKPAKPTVTSAVVTYCLNQTADPIAATGAMGNTLTWYTDEALTQVRNTPYSPVTTTAGDQAYFVTQTNGFNCESDAEKLVVRVYPLLANNLIEDNQTLCFGSAANALVQKANTALSGGAGSGSYTFQWQSRPADNSTDWTNVGSNGNSASYSPGVLTGSTQFKRIVNSDKCNNESEPVIITIQSALANYNISADQTICAGTAPDKLLGGETTGGSGTNAYQWESSTNNSIWSVVGNERDYQPGTLSATTYYRRTVSSGQCSMTSNIVTITVNPRPVLNTIGNLVVCNNATVNGINFSSSLPSGVTYNWTNDKVDIGLGANGSGSIGSFTAVNHLLPKEPLKATISVTPTYTYNNVGCAGDRKDFTITVLPLITIQTIANQVVCTGTKIEAYTPVHDAGTYTGSSVSYKWNVSGAGISLSDNNGTQIPYYTTTNTGTTDLVATVTVTPLYKYQEYTCEGTPVRYQVTVKSATPSAAAGPDKTLCAVTEYNMQATAIAGTTGSWTQVGDNDVAIDEASSATTKITGLQPGKVYQFKWTVKGFESCPATEDEVVITNRPVPTTAHAGSYGPICDLVNTKTITLDANADASRSYEKGEWSAVSPTGATATFSDQSNPKSTVTFNKAGDYKLVWTISNDAGCTPSASETLISVYDKPVAGSLDATRNVCAGNNVVVTLNGAVGTIYQWQYKTASGSDWMEQAGTGNSNTFTNVQETFAVRVLVRSKGYGLGCNLEEITQPITINVAPPTVPGTTAGEQTVCKGVEGGTITLSGNTGDVVRWEYSEDGARWISIPNSTSNSYIYASLLTTTWFRAVVKSGACGELFSTSTKIRVLNPVTQANAGPDQRLCNASSIDLSGNAPGAYENGTWTVVGGSGVTIESPRNAQTKVSVLQPGTYTFRWTLANGYCSPTSDEVTIIIDAPLTNNISLPINTICAGQQAVLIGSGPTGGNGHYDYQWQSSVDGANWTSINGATGVSLTFTPARSVWVKRLVTSLPCTSESAPVFITVQAAIDNNTISADQQICINTAAPVLRGSLPTGGDGHFIYTWEQREGSGAWTVIAGANGQDYDPGVLTQTTSYRRKVETNLCSGAQAKESNIVTITVNPDARAEFVPTKILACAPFALTPSVVGLKPDASRNGDYEWYVNDVSIGRGQTFPGYTIADEGDTIMLKLVAISKFGCLNSEQSQEFTTFIAPRPAFVLTPSEGCGPLTVGIQNTTPYASLFTYRWDFGNGETATGQQPGQVIFQPNPTYGDTIYTIKLTATSSCEVVSTTREVKVKSKPKALFTPSKTVGCSPMTVTFNNTSKGIGNSYEWDFGDGFTESTSSTELVSHTFHTGVQDTFHVKLRAINECGEDEMGFDIVVAPNAIKLDFALNGEEHYGCAPHTVSFINNTKGATGFQWDFGDGNTTRTTKNIDTVKHVYQQPGKYTVTLRAFNGCSDTTSSEVIEVFAKPRAAFSTNAATVCLGDTVRFENSSDDATTYSWRFGDGAVSSLARPVHHYTQTGVYQVVLITQRVNEPGNVCIDSVAHQVEVTATQKGWFEVSDSVSTCAPFTVVFTNKNTPSVSAQWDFGDGTTASGDVVTHTYQRSGNYAVVLTTLVPGGCTYVTGRHVRITGPDGTLAYKGGYVCNDQAVRFEATVSNTDSLFWNFGDGTTLRTRETIVYHRYEKGGTYLPSVTLSGAAQCHFFIGGQDSIKVDKIKAGFTATDDKLCGSTTVLFRDTAFAYFGLSEVQWKLGDGLTSKGSSFQHTYTTSGDYPVQQIVMSSSGCSDTLERVLNVKVYDIPDASIVALDSSCTGTSVSFQGLVQSEDSVSLYRWTTSNHLSGSEQQFKAVFSGAGSYDLRLVAGTVYGCYDTVSHRIKINPTPVVTASKDVILCRGNSTQLSVSGTLKYSWSPLEGLSCTSCDRPVAGPLVTTPYVVEGKNLWNCPAYDTVVVTVIQPFKIKVTASDSICIGTSKQLVASGASSYRWSPGAGLSDSTISNPLAMPTASTHYRVVGYDNFNCFTDTASVLVGVGGYSTVSLGADQLLSTGTMYDFHAEIKDGPVKTWNWNPATDLSCADCASPIAHIKNDISYTVQVTNYFKCTSSDTLNIKVFCQNSQVFIPNAFTPDGDGVNDILMVRAKGIAVVKSFRIFNRWGEVVFERSNFTPNDARSGWDGRIRGVTGGPDVYVYTAEVVCENGVPFTYKGNVSILK